MRRGIWRTVLLAAWILIQSYLFTFKYSYIMTTAKLNTYRGILGHTLAISRASAAVINFNSSIIFFCICRVTLTYLRSLRFTQIIGLPIDDAVTLHKLAGHSTCIFSIVHAIGHYLNFAKFSRHSGANAFRLLFLNNTGLTGHILLLVLLLIVVTASVPVIKAKKHEVFFYTHKLFLVYVVALSLHGTFCFIKTDDPSHPCISAQSWIWVLPGLTLYIAESAYTFVRARRFTYVSKVIQHQSRVFELQLRKPSFSFIPGQYLLLNIPSVSLFQWHPFTITSAPEDGFIAIHIRIVGDWTKEAAAQFGMMEGKIVTPEVMPKVYIDGPYGAPCQNFEDYEVVVCVGAGIGQTPFSSVLRSIWYGVVHPSDSTVLRKVIYIGICRSILSFEWFHDVLRALENQDTGHLLDIRFFLTGQLKPEQVHDIMHSRRSSAPDPITGLLSQTFFGRPNFDPILREIREKYAFCRIGLFYCGPPKLAKQISGLCKKYSDSDTSISFHKEHFEQ